VSKNTTESLQLLKSALATPDAEISKGFVQNATPTQGLQGYDLEGPAKTLYPVLTPLRNLIARDVTGYSSQANWKAVTGINVQNVDVGVSEGNRNAALDTETKEYFAAFRTLGTEDFVTFEADHAAKGYEDVKARAVEGTLRSLMIGEEQIILGGNASVQLGTTPTPVLADAGAGALGSQTLSVVCVALTHRAATQLLGLNNGSVGQRLKLSTARVPQLVTRTNADGSVDTFGGGSAAKSAAETIVVDAGSAVTARILPVTNAYGYAWFWGAAGSEFLGAVTSLSAVTIDAVAAGTQSAATLVAGDHSTNSLHFDGLLTQISKPGSGSYVAKLASNNTGLTSDGAGGVVEIEDAFVSFYQDYRLSPDKMYVSAQEKISIAQVVLSSGSAPAVNFTIDISDPTKFVAGGSIGMYLNKITNTFVEIIVHPNMPAGTIMFFSSSLPYSLSGVADPLKMKLRKDYYSMDWPVTTRKYTYGVYMDGVLQNYFPPAFGIITNIAKS